MPRFRPLLVRLGKELRALLWPLLVIGAAKSSLGSVNYVPSGSMEPTVLVGDVLFVNHLAYGLRLPFTTVSLARWADPSRGEVVTCFEPGDGTRLVKRVIGVPGDRIELRNDILTVNGRPAGYAAAGAEADNILPVSERSQAWVVTETADGSSHAVLMLPARPAWRNYGPFVVPAGSYFLMGDNRDNSRDSRYFGPVPRSQIIGRARNVVVSFDPDHFSLPRRQRILTNLQ